MQFGNIRNSQLKISRWDEIEMFLKFYETRKIKCIDPFVKPFQLNENLKSY